MQFPSCARVALAAVVFSTLAGPAVAADEVFAPEFGVIKFDAAIRNVQGEPDVDGFVGFLVQGETLDVKFAAGKKETTRVLLEVEDPEGTIRDVTIIEKKDGAKLQIKKLPIDMTGPWIVRLTSLNGAQGKYRIQFKLKQAKPLKFKKQLLSPTELERAHPFGALEGSLLTIKLKSSAKESIAKLASLKDVEQEEVLAVGTADPLVDLAVTKKTKVTLSKQVIGDGNGEYFATVGIDEGSATYSMTLKVVPRARPTSKKPVTLFDANDPFLFGRPEPIVTAPGETLRLQGLNLLPNCRVLFDEVEAEDVTHSTSQNFVDVVAPEGLAGRLVGVRVINSDNQSYLRRDLVFFPLPPQLFVGEILTGVSLPGNVIPLAGGHRVRVTGSSLDNAATLKLDGVELVPVLRGDALIEFIAPAHAPGPVDLEVIDAFDRSSLLTSVLHYQGFVDQTVSRLPAPSAVDDYTSGTGALGDVDADGRPDDLVMGSLGRLSRYDVPQTADLPGTRTEYLRGLFNDALGIVRDTTTANIPKALSDSAKIANWNAADIAIGDLDGDFDFDVVLAGTYGVSPYPSKEFLRVQFLTNDGVGKLKVEETWTPNSGFVDEVNASYPVPDEDPATIPIKGPRQIPRSAVALAIGDVDGDGDPDVFVGYRRQWSLYVYNDPSYVDYKQDPPYIDPDEIVPIEIDYFQPGVRLLDNQIKANGVLVDRTTERLPSAGTSLDGPMANFACHDLALGDVDGDGDLDLVTTFSNPAAATALGTRNSYAYFDFGGYYYEYDGSVAPVVATRVLLNDKGTFKDETATWMPAASHPEWWQAHRMLLQDFDGDGRRDLVLLHKRALDRYTQRVGGDLTRTSLRILRNTGGAFVDVTATALPPLVPGSKDNYRGEALAAADFNHDGFVDLVVSTREVLRDQANARIPSTRIFFGGEGLKFRRVDEFFFPVTLESGEAHALVVGDLEKQNDVSMFLLSETKPNVSPGGRSLRLYKWLD